MKGLKPFIYDQQKVLRMLDQYVELIKREAPHEAQKFFWGEETPTRFKQLVRDRIHAQGIEFEECLVDKVPGFAIWRGEATKPLLRYDSCPYHQMGHSDGCLPWRGRYVSREEWIASLPVERRALLKL